MVFGPKDRSKTVAHVSPNLKFGHVDLSYVNSFKYLGHIITSDLSDDADIQREIKSMFVRTNILIRKFAICSRAVKIVLFKSYCLCLYGNALWRSHSIGKFAKLLSCYNKCIKLLFCYDRRYSVTQMLFELGLPCFKTVVHNGKHVVHNVLR